MVAPEDEEFLHEQRERARSQRRLLIRSWKARDELYKQIFGPPSQIDPPSYAPPSEIVTETIVDRKSASLDTADPGDPALEEQQLAIIAYGPDPQRPHWTYVTAGLSTPWLQQQPDEVSGFGCELIIKSPMQAKWPAQILRSMAFYIFNDAGTISPGVRIALNAPIAVNTDSLLRNLFVWYADEAPDCWYQLPAGGFGLFCAMGITDDELKYAESVEEYGNWCIQEVLRRVGHGQISDPARSSIMKHADIEELLQNAKKFADSFRTGGLGNLM